MPFPKEERYTAEEFFKLTPDKVDEHCELLGGIITALAAPSELHQRLVGGIHAELYSFIKSNKSKCTPFVSPFDVVLDDNNVVQPDVLVVCDKDKLDGKRCNGAPDFVVEVTSSNRSVDFTRKLALYAESGVREYWIVDTEYKRVITYFFDKSNSPYIYTFDMPIPVKIYNDELNINISELLNQ